MGRLVKCNDPDKKIDRCIYSIDPESVGVLTTKDMIHLGWGYCVYDKCNYLIRADRLCKNYAAGVSASG